MKDLRGRNRNTSTSFKTIPGFRGMYKINESGTVISSHKNKTRILNHQIHRGYPKVHLTKKRREHTYFFVHRLVLLAFIGPSKLPCNHKDGNKLNCHISNLEYVTSQQNVIHSLKVLGVKRAKGEANAHSKLTEKQVLKIRKSFKPYRGILTKLAKKYGVKPTTIHRIVNRESWKHI